MTVPYALVRSNRRTLALTIDSAGTLTARAPLRMPQRDIEAFIRQKQEWIDAKQAQLRRQAKERSVYELSEGGLLPFYGEFLTLRFRDVTSPKVLSGVLLLPRKKPAVTSLVGWLRTQAQSLLGERVTRLAKAMNLAPSSIHYTTARTRWGSMNNRGALRLNLALLLCPPSMADYVIVHELAHMLQPNHSRAFWALVEQWMPGYEDRRAWLKQNSHLTGLLQKP
ncbi:MAG: M48 family metallopeptidase [Clostridiales bacterium]|nr:M48 family metallopeptidase [Clostridiales bacterium]